MRTILQRYAFSWAQAGLYTCALTLCMALAVFFLVAISAYAVNADPLLQLSLEELMQIEVTSASKKEQTLSRIPAAVTVITQEDIRRSTATTIPGLLRQVPGLNVARINADGWAVSSRGFNERFSNKLLVLIDGRPIYTPLFAGVYWPIHETMLETIDRIEVIRGPGGSVWGANAFNGVINIITKNAADTQGVHLTGIVGDEEKARAGFRLGAGGEHLAYRINVLYSERGEQTLREDGLPGAGGSARDRAHTLVGGFRTDAQLSRRDVLTVTGGLYDNQAQEPSVAMLFGPPYAALGDNRIHTIGGHLLARWEHTLDARSDLSFQVFVDHMESHQYLRRPDQDIELTDRITTLDLECTHLFQPLDRHEIVWGLGARTMFDYYDSSDTYFWSYDPKRREHVLYSGFVQDEIELFKDRFWLTLGAKLEHNAFTGLEFAPSAKGVYSIDDTRSVWASISRAVRTPSRQERDTKQLFVDMETAEDTGLPVDIPLFLQGSDDYSSEEVWALEAGYRTRPSPAFSLDANLFYNFYNSLRTYDGPELSMDPTPALYSSIHNNMKGEGYGLELSTVLDFYDWWRVKGAYSYLYTDLWLINGSTADYTRDEAQDMAPRHSLFLQSRMDLPRNVELDVTLRCVDKLRFTGVPAYTELDLRLGWEPQPGLQVDLIGRNLLNESHYEFFDNFFSRRGVEIDRTAFVRVSWSF